MKQTALTIVLLSLVCTGLSHAESYMVVFETIDCTGKSGFVTTPVESIYKIQDGDCSDPNNPDQRLKQLLVHDGSGSYIVHTLGQDAAREVMNDIKSYSKARLGVLERANTIIIAE